MNISPKETDSHQTDQLKSETWTTRSKKEMLLGFSLMLAGIGIEPVFFAFSTSGGLGLLWIPLAVIGVGVYVIFLGFDA